MLEKVYGFSTSDTKNVERLIDDDHVVINHMILPKGAGLPLHYTNSNVYMIITRGNMTLILDDQEPHQCTHGQIINIPYNVKMNAINFTEDVLEFFVVKSPNPKNYGDK